MEKMESVFNIASKLITIAIPFFLYWFYTYMKSRAENLATKQDIGDITRRIEEAKLEYSMQLEAYKHEMIKKYEYDKVLIDIKIDIFRSLISLKKKLILSKNELGAKYPNLIPEMYEEMQNIMIQVDSIANIDQEIVTLNHQLNSEYNKFTSHLLDIQSKGGSKFTYDFGEFERILNALQLALMR